MAERIARVLREAEYKASLRDDLGETVVLTHVEIDLT
jgi:hypothetical protein